MIGPENLSREDLYRNLVVLRDATAQLEAENERWQTEAAKTEVPTPVHGLITKRLEWREDVSATLSGVRGSLAMATDLGDAHLFAELAKLQEALEEL